MAAHGTIRFGDYAIAFHYLYMQGAATEMAWAEQPTSGMSMTSPGESDVEFLSLERDLLSHVFRGQPAGLVRSQLLRPPDRGPHDKLGEPVRLLLPRRLVYVAEGETKALELGADDGSSRTVSLLLHLSQTAFESGRTVVHAVLRPDPAAAEMSWVSEIECIALAKHWEHGEGVGVGERHDIRRQVLFASEHTSRPVSFERLLESYLSATVPRPLTSSDLRAGTIQVNTLNASCWCGWPELYLALAEFDQRCGSLDTATAQTVRAVAGMLQGLLDYEFVEPAELADVLYGARTDGCLLAIHKGTLLYLTDNCRVFSLPSVRDAIGISPYLLLPNAVLVHNEALAWHALRESRGAPLYTEAAIASADSGLTQMVKALQSTQRHMHDVLQRRWLPNVFHYPTERWLYDHGHRSRGLDALHQHLMDQLDHVSGRLDSVRNAIEARFQRRLGRLGLVLAIFGLPLSVIDSLGGWSGFLTEIRQPGPQAALLVLALGGIASAAWSGRH